ncbi:serine/threonine-protein kinase [Methylobacterium sp. 37f]|uniref:serine/threonine-protein kinase n=1 Tax=Methylobacterium sp. 37f TaxID=2817058 RepID=UPI00249428CE|nr:serine/threonine-protein kinase [Methylobacterium sp. 37f]
MEETRFAPGPYIRLRQGTRLNGIYEIESYITAGGMGEIYKGRSIANGDVVAIKTVRPELGQDPAVLSLFKREASALHNLNHPAIVRYFLFSIDQDLGLPYLAMEYVEGAGLSKMLRQTPLTADQAFTLLHRLATGLDAAHEFGIIHRDLSPDNVLIPHGEVAKAKIIDFGIARSILGEGTIIGSGFAGKMNYVSPEQLGLFGGDVGPRSDIYSLALVIAEAVRGEPLKMGRSQVDVINARRAVPDLSGIDKVLRPVLQSMLQPNPKDRPANMGEVASRVPPGLASGQQTQIGKKRRPQPSPESKSRWGRPASVASLVVVLLAAAGGGSLFVLRPDLLGLAGSAPQTGPSAPDGGWPPPADPPPSPSPTPPTVAPPPSSPQGRSGPDSAGPRPSDQRPSVQNLPRQEAPVQRPVPQAPPAPPPIEKPPGPDGGQDSSGRASDTGESTALAGQEPDLPPGLPSDLPPDLPPDTRPEPPRASPTMRNAGEREIRSFIRSYDGGPCFYTSLVRAGRGSATVEALGASPIAFMGFDSAVQRTFGFEPQINLRQVAEPQCPVVTALAAQETQRVGRPPTLTLKSDQVRSGGNMIVTADARADKHVELLLVADDGQVHSLSRFTKREGDTLTVTLQLIGSRPEGETAPQLVVALASPRPLAGLIAGLKAGSVGADKFFRQLADERAKGPIGISAKYFILSGGA